MVLSAAFLAAAARAPAKLCQGPPPPGRRRLRADEVLRALFVPPARELGRLARLPRRLLLPAAAGVLRARVRPWRRVGGAGAEHGAVPVQKVAVGLLVVIRGGILLFGRLGKLYRLQDAMALCLFRKENTVYCIDISTSLRLDTGDSFFMRII
jgi:hypothetical protein